MKKDIEFYNKESNIYFEKRYLGKIDNFIKYFFNRRLNLFLSFFGDFLKISGEKKIKILDIGCADGYVMSRAFDLYPENIKLVVGEDTSPNMITKAKKLFGKNYPFDFRVRGEDIGGEYDIAIELGVPISDWRKEFEYVTSRLKSKGFYIFSTPGSKDSLYSLIKKDFHVDEPMTFKEFDKLINEFFEIKNSRVYAFFVPKLWKFPALARLLQPVFENIFSHILSNLFHEKIYLLKKKD